MKIARIIALVFVLAGLLAPRFGFAQSENADKEEPTETISWQALAENAKELDAMQHGADDLSVQVEAKERHMEQLSSQRSGLLRQIERVDVESHKAIKEIDRIDDKQLRDESLLRFKSSKDVRMTTLKATLAAVEESITREERELGMLQRSLESRRASARLYGLNPVEDGDYAAMISDQAESVRQNEADAYEQLRARRAKALAMVILPRLKPHVPSLSAEVLSLTPGK